MRQERTPLHRVRCVLSRSAQALADQIFDRIGPAKIKIGLTFFARAVLSVLSVIKDRPFGRNDSVDRCPGDRPGRKRLSGMNFWCDCRIELDTYGMRAFGGRLRVKTGQ